MHFNYDEYPGAKFFMQWCTVINSRMTNFERILLLGYFILIIFYLISGTRKERIFWSLQPLTLLIIVLNPWAMSLWIKILGNPLKSRVFRFFWLLPIVMTYAYFFTNIYGKTSQKRYRVIMLMIILIVGMSQIGIGTRNTFTGVYENEGFQIIENYYKIQDDTIAVAEIVEKDKKDICKKTRVGYDGNMSMEIRTYDASIISATGTLFDYQVSDKEIWDSLIQDENWQAIVSALVSGTIADARWLSEYVIETALSEVDINYAIVNKNNFYIYIWDDIAECIGESDNYFVYKL